MEFLFKLFSREELLERTINLPFETIVESFDLLIKEYGPQHGLLEIIDTAIKTKLDNKEVIPVDVLPLLNIDQLHLVTKYQDVPDQLFNNLIKKDLVYLCSHNYKQFPELFFLYFNDDQLEYFIKNKEKLFSSNSIKMVVINHLLHNKYLTKMDSKWFIQNLLDNVETLKYFKDQVKLVDQKHWIVEVLINKN